MAPPFALPPPDFPLPAYVRRVESGLLMPRKAVLPGLYMPPGLMGGQGAIELEYVVSLSDTNNRQTYTFSDVNIGTPAPGRLVIVGTTNINAGANMNLVSGTIAGQPAAVHINPGGEWHPTGIMSLVVPAGSTAPISVTFTAVSHNCTIFVWTLKNYKSVLPVSTGGLNRKTGVGSVSLNIPANGVAVYVFGQGETSASATWSTATRRTHGLIEGHRYSAADKYAETAIANHTETVSTGVTSNGFGMSGASWS